MKAARKPAAISHRQQAIPHMPMTGTNLDARFMTVENNAAAIPATTAGTIMPLIFTIIYHLIFFCCYVFFSRL
jgi:hypothetical protein